MKPRNKKSVLIMNIVLLVIFVPLACIGTITHFKNGGTTSKKGGSNPNKEFFYDGKLYFYDFNNLLGTYDCTNDLCNFAYSANDDKDYDLNYLKSEDEMQVKLANNKFAFIMDVPQSSVTSGYDNVDVNVYDVTNERVLTTLKGVKNYGVGIDNDYYIVKNEDGLWGVIQASETIKTVIPYNYKYIGLHKTLANNSNKLESEVFVVLDDNGWKLINNLNVDISKQFTQPIYDYNANYVITKNNDNYYLNNLEGELVVSFGYKAIEFIGQYIGVLSSSNEFYVIDPISMQDISTRHTVNSIDEVTWNITESGTEIIIGGEVVDTLI